MRHMKIKTGMKGSNKGRSRTEPTARLKKYSKRLRRAEDRQAVKEQV